MTVPRKCTLDELSAATLHQTWTFNAATATCTPYVEIRRTEGGLTVMSFAEFKAQLTERARAVGFSDGFEDCFYADRPPA